MVGAEEERRTEGELFNELYCLGTFMSLVISITTKLSFGTRL